ncbi:MAG TPA: homocysteine S-methyltransferase family protein [Anaeromyxobacter sp.]|nr:homocysteine S-methyltransferase family protein [Anaeromyxobacter sp.]
MDRTDLLLQLLERRPLVCDGAMGTELQALGLEPGKSGEAWNVDHPGRVRRVHQGYLDAGADLLLTNTFGGTSLALSLHGVDPGRAGELNLAGARLAREAAGDRAFVLGDVGPFGGLLAPLGETAPEDAEAAFLAQARALLEGGADAILVETMSDPAELELAASAARRAGARLVVATGTYQRSDGGFRTMMGADPAAMVQAALAAGADAVGANCGTGLSLDDYQALVAEIAAAADGRPVLVKPNAGAPELDPDGAVRYRTGHEAFAVAVPRLLAAGARMVGGCCGTGPAHVAAVAAVIRARG